jgi:hypothetical protein
VSCDCVEFRGKRVDNRTKQIILRCEADFNVKLTLTQGCCNKGAVAASGGTHDCEGVVDFSVNGLTMTQSNRIVWATRKTGLWTWYRPYIKGLWAAHIHGVAVGCKDLPAVAARQITAAREGRDGLRSNRLDPHRAMNLPVITFEKYKASQEEKPPLDISAIVNHAMRGEFTGQIGKIMRAEGVPQTRAGYRRLQRNMGYSGADADGIPGPASLRRLAKEHGYRVVA